MSNATLITAHNGTGVAEAHTNLTRVQVNIAYLLSDLILTHVRCLWGPILIECISCKWSSSINNLLHLSVKAHTRWESSEDWHMNKGSKSFVRKY